MDTLFPSPALLLAFVAASALLAVTPGPAVVYILARTLAQGRAAGLASVGGVALGNLGNAAGAALGLGALFAVSASAFTVVKLVGAAYLVWLGIGMLRQAAAPAHDAPRIAPSSRARVFRDGFVVALLNPKTALFFAAFLPQFMSPGAAGPIAQSLAFGLLFVLIAGASDMLYVLLAALVQPRLARAHGAARWGKRAAGGAFIGLGVLAAFGQRPGR